MSERSLRKSTQDLRKCYHAERTPTSVRRRIRHTPANNQQIGRMAAHQNQVPAADPDDNPDGGEEIPAHLPKTPPVGAPKSPTAQNNEHEERIARLEELLVEKRKAESRRKRTSRSSSRSTAPSNTSNKSGRRRSKSGSRASAHRSSRRRRESPRHRSTSRRSTRSRHRGSTRDRSRSHHRSSRRRSRSTFSRPSHHRSRSHRSTRSRSRSRRPRSSRSRSRRHSSSPRRKAARAVKAQYPEMGKAKGEPLPVKGLPLEPYYNLPPDLRSKARARRSRRDMTFPEYMCGMLSMIAKCAPPDSQVQAAITHAAQVAQDAAGYTWAAVREWSQTALTHVEDGKDDWVDQTGLIARERTRLSWIKGKPPQEVKIPCHAHNTDKCNERATHYSEGKTWVHGCAVCVYAGADDSVSTNAANHTVRTCRRKSNIKYAYDDGRADQKRRPNYTQQKRDYRQEPAKPKN